MAEIDRLNISITSTSTEAAKGIDAIIASFEKLKATLGTDLSSSISQIKTNMQSLSEAFSSINGKSLEPLGNAISGLSKISSLLNMKDSSAKFQALATNVTTFVSSLAQIDEASISRLERLSAAINKLNGTKASISLKNVGNESKKAGDSAKQASKGFDLMDNSLGRMIKSFGRMMRMRTFRLAIMWIFRSIKEGIQSLYQWDKELGNGDFVKSMDKFATAALNIKNSLGLIFQPIMSFLAPAFQKLSEWIMAAANALSRFFALIKGQHSYTKVVATTTTFAESSGLAKDNLKEIKKTLLGFDELNLLNDSKSSGSAGGISDNYKNAFTTATDLTGSSGNVFQSLADKIQNIDWQNIGKTFYEKLKRILTTIDFGNIAKSVSSLLGSALGAAMGFGWGVLKSAFSDAWGRVVKWWEEDCHEDGKFVMKAFLKGILEVMIFPFKWIWENIYSPFADGFGQAFGIKNNKSETFKSKGKNVMDSFGDGLKQSWGSILAWVSPALALLTAEIKGVISLIKEAQNQSRDFEKSTGGLSGGGLGGGVIYGKRFASGGSVPSGQIFMAREAGPELVGSIGTQTVVMNNDQIVSAVSDGVYRAVSAAMDGRNSNVTAHLYIDGREVKTSLNRLSRANG